MGPQNCTLACYWVFRQNGNSNGVLVMVMVLYTVLWPSGNRLRALGRGAPHLEVTGYCYN